MFYPNIVALANTAESMKDQIGETFGERASVAISVTLLGMIAIFAVLSILWGVIELLHLLLNRGNKTETPTEKAVETPKPIATSAKTVAPKKPTATPKNDDALIAVITAAVASAMAEEGYTGGFRVVSFRRTPIRKKRN